MTIEDADSAIAGLADDDRNRAAQALARLIGLGRSATGPIVAALRSAGPSVRSDLVQALAEIGDPEARDTFAGLLDDDDPTVRARAAQGLANVGDPRAAAALAADLDQLEDLLSFPFTLPVRALIALGPEGARAVLPRLDDPNPVTRERALLVVRQVVAHRPEPDLVDALEQFEKR
jgi:HEAT repeat protein